MTKTNILIEDDNEKATETSPLDRHLTQQKQADKVLQRSAERFRRLFEQASEAFFIHDFNNGKIVDANACACKRLGYTRDEFFELTVSDIEVGHTPEVIVEISSGLEKGESVTVEGMHRRKNGSTFPVEINLGMLQDEDPPLLFAIARDTTERNRTVEALRKSEAFLNKSQEISHIGSWDLDLVADRLTWSDEVYRLFGLRPQEFDATYEAFLNFVHPDDRAAVDAAYSGSLREGRDTYEIEHRVVRRGDGEVRSVHEKCEHIRDASGRIVRSLGMVKDITADKQAEEKIMASLKEKEVLLSEIHHRVKNNMQVIISLLRLQAGKIKDKHHADMFKGAENRIRSMALIHETLYQTKDFANVNFNDYVKSISNHLFRSYGVAPDKVSLKMEIDNVSLGLDNAIPCGLIINELISNALKYAFPEDGIGEIKITLQSINDDQIELTVSDNGIGIPAEIDMEKTESLGLQLVNIIAVRLTFLNGS